METSPDINDGADIGKTLGSDFTKKFREDYSETVKAVFFGKKIDFLVVNSKHIQLSFWELEKLKNNISVQWGDYIYLTKDEQSVFEKKWITILEWNLIDKESLYKHDRKELWKMLQKIIV